MSSSLAKVEINCDMGEGFGRWTMGPDEELMNHIDVANIACGFHAGDPTIMLETVRLAKQKGVKAGAHPGLQDLFGFGRRKIEVHPDDMYTMILYQVGALKAMLDAEKVPLNHIKPHGELFFYMQRDEGIMRAVLKAVKSFGVPVYGCQNELQQRICTEMGVDFVPEFYPDIDYDKNGKLVPFAQSKKPTSDEIGERIRRAGTDVALSNSGDMVTLGLGGKPFSVCLHSDREGVLANVAAARLAVAELNGKL